MIKVTTKIIHETPDKKFVIIDGVCYSREAIESWASNELAEFRNKLIHKNHEAAMDYENAIFEAFEPYIKAAKDRQGFDKLNMLRKLIEEMDIADVRFALNTTGYIVLTRSESEAIIDYMGIKSIFDEVFK